MSRRREDLNLQEAAHCADQIVARFGLATLPIDPHGLAEANDIAVVPAALEGCSGCLMKQGDTFGILYSDTLKNDGFERFTVSHELGHFFLPGRDGGAAELCELLDLLEAVGTLGPGSSHEELLGHQERGCKVVRLAFVEVLRHETAAGLVRGSATREQELRMARKSALRLAGKNQAQLAAATARDVKTVGRWLARDDTGTEPKVSDLIAICNALDVSAEFLLGFTPAPRRIRTGNWIVDEDYVAAVRREDGTHLEHGEQGSFEVPLHFTVRTAMEHAALEIELRPHFASIRAKRGEKS